MSQQTWLIVLGVLTTIAIGYHLMSKRRWQKDRTHLVDLLQKQHVNYKEWKAEAAQGATESSQMLDRVFELIAKLITKEVRERLVYNGARYEQEDKVVLCFVTAREQYQKALMNLDLIRERLEQLKQEWAEPWLPTVTVEIQLRKEERGKENHGYRSSEPIIVALECHG